MTQLPAQGSLRRLWDWFLQVIDNSELHQLDAIMLAVVTFAIGCGLLACIYLLAQLEGVTHKQKEAVAPYAVRTVQVPISPIYYNSRSAFGRPRTDFWRPFGQTGQVEASTPQAF